MESEPRADVHAWIADDGELEEIRSLLRDEGIPFGEGAGAPGEPIDLLVSSPRRLLEMDRQVGDLAPGTHIVIAEGLSRTLRQSLQRSSCDFVVEPTLHRSALRLLIHHALYRGPERRSSERVLVDADVKLVAGWQKRQARLLQISPGGCGLVVTGKLGSGAMSLRLPPEWCGGARIDLPLRLLHEDPVEGGQRIVAFAFDRLDGVARRVLRDLMRQRVASMGRLAARSPAKPSQAAATQPPPKAARSPAPPEERALEDDERREFTRARYVRRLLATRDGRAQVVIGRDLSEGGMRIDPDPALAPGDELKLALYGANGQDPVVVRGRVVRDGGTSGMGLAFEPMRDEMRNRLVKLIDSIQVFARPSEAAKHADADDAGVVVSEVLGRRERGGD